MVVAGRSPGVGGLEDARERVMWGLDCGVEKECRVWFIVPVGSGGGILCCGGW